MNKTAEVPLTEMTQEQLIKHIERLEIENTQIQGKTGAEEDLMKYGQHTQPCEALRADWVGEGPGACTCGLDGVLSRLPTRDAP